jgi:hypothetical protein
MKNMATAGITITLATATMATIHIINFFALLKQMETIAGPFNPNNPTTGRQHHPPSNAPTTYRISVLLAPQITVRIQTTGNRR